MIRRDSARSTPAAGKSELRSATQPRVPEPGVLVGGVYRVLGLIGEGAMGVVLLAEDETLGRKVAIKFVRADRLDSSFRERFTMEARAMARVSHPNVLQIHAFGEHNAAPYFVMEFVPGGVTLEEWMERPQPPSVDSALRMMAQLCSGVAAIHAAETLHRDIKPSNILVGVDDHPWVADLGLAIFRHVAGVDGRQIVGTPAYMAPEVAFPGDADSGLGERADVYSLACIAYELVTGYSPYSASGSMAMMLAHATGVLNPPSARRAGLPPLLDAAIMHALARRPLDRTPTVAAFGAALRVARAGISQPARILVADDNDDFRHSLELGLESAFPATDLECVGNGHAALAAFERQRPSVAILDLGMPGLGGLELARLLRLRDPEASVPIIVVTGTGGPREWSVLSAMGVDRLLVKPVALDDLVALVHRLMSDRTKATPTQRLQ